MRMLFWIWICLTSLGCLRVGSQELAGQAMPARGAVSESDQVFGLEKYWKVHLMIPAESWQQMQPTQGGGFGTRPPPGQVRRPGSFGYEFEFARAAVEFDDVLIPELAIRFKGNGTYLISAQGDKRSFKLDFNRYRDGQKFHGLQQLNLHNDAMDPSHCRQVLAYRVFAAAGIPAPRTAFAEVELSIEGQTDRKPLGWYTVVEEVDKAFLRRHYGNAEGMLLKPEGTRGLEYKGEQWDDYAWFEPKTKTTPDQQRRLIEFTRLIHQAEDEEFHRQVGQYLDLPRFARFIAANTLLANLDSFFSQVHNYYIYLPAGESRFELLPWDLDLAFGAGVFFGSPDQTRNLSIEHPHMGENKILDRLLAWPEFKTLYRSELERLTELCLGDTGTIQADLDRLRDVLSQAQAQAQEGEGSGKQPSDRPGRPGLGPPGTAGFRGGSSQGPPEIEAFIVARRQSILDQLAGKSSGWVPRGLGAGPAAGPGRGPAQRGFGGARLFGPKILAAGDQDQDQSLSPTEFEQLGKKWFEEWDSNQDQLLSRGELLDGLNRVWEHAPDTNGSDRAAPGFSSGELLAPVWMRAIDQDKDRSASAPEFSTRLTHWFTEWDKDEDHRLIQQEISDAIGSSWNPVNRDPSRPPNSR